MKRILHILPVLALCAGLTACGDSNTSTTTASDTTIDNSVRDNTGAGMPGAATDAEAAGNAAVNNPSGNMDTGASGSSTGASTAPPAGTTTDRTNGRNNTGTRITAEDSPNNRNGPAPIK